MSPYYGLLAWAFWVGPVFAGALARSVESAWLIAFLTTSLLLLLDLFSFHVYAKFVFEPKQTGKFAQWRSRLKLTGVVILRMAPWAGLIWVLKSFPPAGTPMAHLLGWATLPWTVLGSVVLPRVFKRN